MQSILSWLSISNEKSGSIKNTTTMVTLKDIGLLSDATFIIELEGSNISGTTVLLLNKVQCMINENKDFCNNKIDDPNLKFIVLNNSYPKWSTKVTRESIFIIQWYLIAIIKISIILLIFKTLALS